MTREQINALAEFCGLKWKAIGTEFAWERPNGGLVGIFQPHTDANDCDALIRALMAQGWHVEISFQSCPSNIRLAEYVYAFGVFVHIWHDDTEQHERTDCSLDAWKQGVCELALKVLENSNISTDETGTPTEFVDTGWENSND